MPTTKRVRTALVAALTPMVMICVAAPAASAQLPEAPPIQTYPGDPGRLGDPASWRTPEFNRDNGMVSIGAEFAYAGGYSGTGTNIGVVDSGFFAGHLREHGSLATNYAVGDRARTREHRVRRVHSGSALVVVVVAVTAADTATDPIRRGLARPTVRARASRSPVRPRARRERERAGRGCGRPTTSCGRTEPAGRPRRSRT